MLRRFLLPLIALHAAVAPAMAADRTKAEAELVAGARDLLAGKTRAARVRLLNATKADPGWGLPHALQSRVYLDLGDGLIAETEARRAIELGVPANRVNHLIAHALLLQGSPKKALAEAAEARVAPRFNGYASRIRGTALYRLNQFEPAAREFDRAIALAPKARGLWTDVGMFRFEVGNIAAATQAAQNAIRIDKRDVRANILMADLVRGQYGLVAAIPWFERAVELDPENLIALGELAATQGDAGHTKAMLATTRRMLTIDQQNPRAFYLQAVLAARAKNYDLARAMIYRTQGRMDDIPGVMLLRSLLELQAGNAEGAIARLEDLVRLQPGNLKVQRLLGAAMWQSGDSKGTIDVLKVLAARRDADSYTLSVIGRAYEAQGEREAAAGFLDRAAQPVRGEAVPFELSSDLLRLARANAGPSDNADFAVPYINKLILEGKGSAALSEAERLAKNNPGAPAAHLLVGDALVSLGRPGDAVTAYQRAAAIRFGEPVALRMIEALVLAGRQGEALRVLDLFLSQNPRSVPALLLAGDHFMTTGHWDQAIEVLEGLRLRLGNRDASVLSNLGWAWFNKGEIDKAIEASGAAYAMAPANPAFASAYGWILYKSGRNKEGGVAILTKAVAIAPNHPQLRYQLGQALIGIGDRERAREHLRVAADNAEFADRQKAAALLAGLR